MMDMSKINNKGLLDSLRGFDNQKSGFENQKSGIEFSRQTSYNNFLQPKSIGNTPNVTLKDRLNLKPLQPIDQERQHRNLKHIAAMRKRMSLED